MIKFPQLRSLILSLIVCAGPGVFCVTGSAQSVEGISQREIARRQAALPEGQAAVARGKAAMQERDYTLAHQEYRSAVAYLPDAVTSGSWRDQAVEGFCESGVKVAQQYIAEGKYRRGGRRFKRNADQPI